MCQRKDSRTARGTRARGSGQPATALLNRVSQTCQPFRVDGKDFFLRHAAVARARPLPPQVLALGAVVGDGTRHGFAGAACTWMHPRQRRRPHCIEFCVPSDAACMGAPTHGAPTHQRAWRQVDFPTPGYVFKKMQVGPSNFTPFIRLNKARYSEAAPAPPCLRQASKQPPSWSSRRACLPQARSACSLTCNARASSIKPCRASRR